MDFLIRTYTNPGDVVLDNTAGSGTTGVACVGLDRDCILIEKDPLIARTAAARVVEAQTTRAHQLPLKEIA
jgi:site-specific DNA-methyltransferase (adenine-specific)